MPFIRSLLFVPAVRPRFIEKAPEVGADLVCLDLEDSVPPSEKPKARQILKEIMPTMPRTGYYLFVRVNGIQTGLLEEDLAAVVGTGLDGISLPKADSPEIIRQVDAYLTLLERERQMPVGQVKIIPWLETALGIVNAYAMCRASPRLIGASFGAEDFTTDMEIERTKLGREIEWPRAWVAICCKAAGILPIDTPEPDYSDLGHLEEVSLFARSLGYRGKYCIHPSQVAVVNRVFAPSQEEVERAQRVVAAYEEGEKQGLGDVSLEGVMVDRPIYVRARRILEWAAAMQGGEMARQVDRKLS